MNAMDFYLFDVAHGQSAALQLPNGRWCLFDLGASDSFSPLGWIGPKLLGGSILKTTVSHLHGDHLLEAGRLTQIGSEYLKLPSLDAACFRDLATTAADGNGQLAVEFWKWYSAVYTTTSIADYGGVTIFESALPSAAIRAIGGSANTRVNNGSVVTRINYLHRSVLLCGDMEASGWEFVLSNPGYVGQWLPLVSQVDVLVAPHHGHSSGYSAALLGVAAPDLVLVSVASRDPSVDPRYSDSGIPGLLVDGRGRRRLTTRSDGHIRVSFLPSSSSARGDVNVSSSLIAPPLTSIERSGLVELIVAMSRTGGC